MKREYLIECFEYNPDTGILIWKERPRHHFLSTPHDAIVIEGEWRRAS